MISQCVRSGFHRLFGNIKFHVPDPVETKQGAAVRWAHPNYYLSAVIWSICGYSDIWISVLGLSVWAVASILSPMARSGFYQHRRYQFHLSLWCSMSESAGYSVWRCRPQQVCLSISDSIVFNHLSLNKFIQWALFKMIYIKLIFDERNMIAYRGHVFWEDQG